MSAPDGTAPILWGRLLEQRWPITAALSDPEVTPKSKQYFDLKPDQWSLLDELTQGLQPFQCATEFLSGQEYATPLCLPKLAKGLQRSVEQSLSFETTPGKAFLAKASKDLTERWGIISTFSKDKDNAVLLSAALDPRFRKLEVYACRTEDRGSKHCQSPCYQSSKSPGNLQKEVRVSLFQGESNNS